MSYMEIRNLKKVYNPYGIHPKVALNGLDFEVEKGDFICIMGASGSGKTTLVNILSTIDEATHGQIFLNQKDLLLLSEKEKANLRKEEIGFIFQNYNLIGNLTVLENITLPIELDGNEIPYDFINEILHVLKLEDKKNIYPNKLSGGQQQRVAIARALATRPSIILADEPTGNLDSKTTQEVIGLIKRTSHLFKQTIVMITHNEDIAQLADRIIKIEDGKLRENNDE